MSSTETGLRPGPDAAATRGPLDAPLRDREARIVARPESDAAGLRRRLEGTRSSVAFPYLLLPSFWSSRNRARRRERGDSVRLALFGCVGLAVLAALFGGSFWVTLQLDQYAELGDFLLRLGLSWLFLTLLSFLAFSGVVTALSTFFLSDDLRLLLAAPIDKARLFHARFLRTLGQSSWMVVVFLFPVRAGGVLSDRRADRGAVRGDSGRAGQRRHAGAGEPVSRPACPRHSDADEPAVRGQHHPLAAIHATGTSASGRVAARRHRVLYHLAISRHPVVAVVLGRRGDLCQPAGRLRPVARRCAVDDRAGADGVAPGGQRPLVFLRVQQGPGGAQDELHPTGCA